MLSFHFLRSKGVFYEIACDHIFMASEGRAQSKGARYIGRLVRSKGARYIGRLVTSHGLVSDVFALVISDKMSSA